jgi:hypothetical protein
MRSVESVVMGSARSTSVPLTTAATAFFSSDFEGQ